ncbi:MAG: alpha/beta hydrolase [Cyanobacteria bacterium SZAS TMP-1]|nr:alpha/beta hydrolase [Cyanobacteria bacterium SZAS TMP-1]
MKQLTLTETAEDRATVTRAIGEFFTPAPMEYRGFAPELLSGAQEIILSNGLHAHRWRGAGKTVLLVHGWGGNSAQLAGFVKPLLSQGKQVIAVDMWAHGLSPGVESNCVKFAEGIAATEREFGHIDQAVGHSLGAASILVAANSGVKLDKAVLISPPSILLVMEKFLGMKKIDRRLLEAFIQMGERYVGRSRRQADALMVSPFVQIPFLLIHDERDRRCPISVSQELSAAAENRPLITTHGLGHNRIIDAPEVIEQAVAYLS